MTPKPHPIVTIKDANGKELNLDPIVNAIPVIDVEHHELHEGEHYSVSGFQSKDTDETVSFHFILPDPDEMAHMTFEVGGTSQTELHIYRNADCEGGTTVEPINNNECSDNTSAMVMKANPKVISTGTLIYSQSRGKAGATPAKADVFGIASRQKERIFKGGVSYLAVLTSRDDGNILTWTADWYEHNGADES